MQPSAASAGHCALASANPEVGLGANIFDFGQVGQNTHLFEFGQTRTNFKKNRLRQSDWLGRLDLNLRAKWEAYVERGST